MHALWPSYPGCPATVVDGPDDMRRTVRELLRAGADVLKVATTGGVISPRSDPRRAYFGPDEIAVLMAEARAARVSVMAHAHGTDGIKNAVRAGVRSIEHGVYLDEEAVEMMVDHGTWLVPTLSAPRALLRDGPAAAGAHRRHPRQGRRRCRGTRRLGAAGACSRSAHRDGDRRRNRSTR